MARSKTTSIEYDVSIMTFTTHTDLDDINLSRVIADMDDNCKHSTKSKLLCRVIEYGLDVQHEEFFGGVGVVLVHSFYGEEK